MNPLILLPILKNATLAVDAVTLLTGSVKALKGLFTTEDEPSREEMRDATLLAAAILWQSNGDRSIEIAIEPLGDDHSSMIVYAYDIGMDYGRTVSMPEDFNDF